MTQLYFSYAMPAIAAGATPCKSWRKRWLDAAGRAYHSAIDFLREHDLSPVRIDPPKTKSMAAIKRASEAATRTRLLSSSLPAKERAAIRAYQYALTMTGNECGHSISIDRRVAKHVAFDRNAEGRNVPRRVDLGGAIPFEIPHWDFVPEEPRLIVERPAYRAPSHFYSSASALQMAA